MIKLTVCGACGRMGRRIVALAHESKIFEITEALEREAHPQLGADIGEIAGLGPIGVKVAVEPTTAGEVMIDFSLPQATASWAQYCGRHRLPLVVGTTGLTDQAREELETAAHQTPVLIGANMSLGVNLLFQLAGQVAQKLGEDYDVEIVETHHRFKRDAPSGTALELSRQIAAAHDWPWPDCAAHGRQGKEALRQPRTIGLHAVRAGDVIGEHHVIYSTLGETVELRHRAHTRDTFVRGALRAAQWLIDQPPGPYTMADVLGL